ncbi:MAG TPA: hypothetical protein VKH64_05255 [Candidatus Binatia bacterium]|nr:hypothetical protein [Candidatus Binatia bacterium]
MTLKRKIAAVLLAVSLAPATLALADEEMKATVVSKSDKEIKVKVKDAEKTLQVGSKTKGLDNAKEGAKVTIKYSEKDGKLRAEEISPR